MTLYAVKPMFQACLRPLTARLAAAGVTANQVTIAAAAGSCLVGLLVAIVPVQGMFMLLPAWLLVRMALNAIDGMLAREHGQASRLGACLNELGDTVSDAALYAPFALVAPLGAGPVVLVIGLAVLSEYAGVLGVVIGSARRYEGPMGKSDRALAFGALGLWIGLGGALPAPAAVIPWILALLLVLTIVNRLRAALREAPASEMRS
ncbi:CDP-alcohol phosphatidyltransferase family protein [Salinarimonas soli]|uniref:CDP-alcohol phosphatidyltransferase family protein n=1 Tax=Salinarimonas soli TaxID=1638099 RepID=A0A5B2VJ20_9HYPH|nr:CDP-alcohol phosphatidyltransferase family protein [Salinarimonas soli]KAA2238269.1 CDP-alcohol phosphatidyltransferase family protein [Salinarimonas soli]